MRVTLLLAMTLALGSIAHSGVLQLKDGTRVEGELRRANGGWEVVTAPGVSRFVAEDQVVSIESTGSDIAQPGEASARVASLRRAVEAMDNIPEIIARWETLLKLVEKTPAADEVRGEIARWRDHEAKGMVRVGKRWLDPAALEQLEERHFAAVEQARSLVAEGKLREAGAAVDRVLEEDPRHVGALYLKAIVSFRQEQLPVARRAMEQLVGILPSHWPSVHNLAVLQWSQRSPAAALSNFERAMDGMPLVPAIHDNVAEVLQAITPDQRQSAATRRLQARFAADEPRLQAQLEKQNLFRWGSSWVTSTQLKQLRERDEQIRARLDELTKQFGEIEANVQEMDRSIARLEDSITDIERSRWVRDDQGRLVRLSYPPGYHSLNSEVDAQKSRRTRELARLDQVRREADQTRSQLSAPPFTGRLRMLDELHTPTRLRSGKSAMLD